MKWTDDFIKTNRKILIQRQAHTGRRWPCEDTAEIEVTTSQAKEQLGPPAIGTGKKQFFSRD